MKSFWNFFHFLLFCEHQFSMWKWEIFASQWVLTFKSRPIHHLKALNEYNSKIFQKLIFHLCSLRKTWKVPKINHFLMLLMNQITTFGKQKFCKNIYQHLYFPPPSIFGENGVYCFVLITITPHIYARACSIMPVRTPYL